MKVENDITTQVIYYPMISQMLEKLEAYLGGKIIWQQ